MFKSVLGDPSKIQLVWTAGEQGEVGVDATTQILEDRQMEISGTSAIDANCTYDVDHGLLLTCQGGAADQVAVMPSSAASDYRSPWREITWGTDREVEFEAVMRTGTLSNTVIYVVGLLLTFPATFVEGDDNDRVVFNYLQGTDTTWQLAVNIGGTDLTINTGITVTATEVVHFAIRIDKERRARCYINEELVYTTTPLTDVVDLLPCVAIETGGAAANDMHVRSMAISRRLAD